MEDMAHGNSVGNRLRFIPETGRIEVVNSTDPDSSNLGYTPDDFKFSEDDEKNIDKSAAHDGAPHPRILGEVKIIFDDDTKEIRIVTENDNQENRGPIFSMEDLHLD